MKDLLRKYFAVWGTSLQEHRALRGIHGSWRRKLRFFYLRGVKEQTLTHGLDVSPLYLPTSSDGLTGRDLAGLASTRRAKHISLKCRLKCFLTPRSPALISMSYWRGVSQASLTLVLHYALCSMHNNTGFSEMSCDQSHGTAIRLLSKTIIVFPRILQGQGPDKKHLLILISILYSNFVKFLQSTSNMVFISLAWLKTKLPAHPLYT